MSRPVMLAIGIWVSVAVGRGADDPVSKAEVKPQWERMLQGEDAERAAELDKRIERAEEQDKYDEAVRAAMELLALRERGQGKDHWEVVSAKWAMAKLIRVSRLPTEQRAEWRKVATEDKLAGDLYAQGKYADAQRHNQKSLDLCLALLGERHPDTAACYNN